MGSCEYLLCSWLVRIAPGLSLVCFCLGTFVQTAAHTLKALHLLYSPEHPICPPAWTLHPPPAPRGPLPRTLSGAWNYPSHLEGLSHQGLRQTWVQNSACSLPGVSSWKARKFPETPGR